MTRYRITVEVEREAEEVPSVEEVVARVYADPHGELLDGAEWKVEEVR